MVVDGGEPKLTEEEMEPVFPDSEEDSLHKEGEEPDLAGTAKRAPEPEMTFSKEPRPDMEEEKAFGKEVQEEQDEVQEQPEPEVSDDLSVEVEKLLAQIDIFSQEPAEEPEKEGVSVKLLASQTEEQGLKAAASYLREQRKAAGLEKGKAARVSAEKLNKILLGYHSEEPLNGSGCSGCTGRWGYMSTWPSKLYPL